MGKLVQLAKAHRQRIQHLSPPGSMKAQWDEYLADAGRASSMLADAATKAQTSEASGAMGVIAEVHYGRTTVFPLARRLGFTACVR